MAPPLDRRHGHQPPPRSEADDRGIDVRSREPHVALEMERDPFDRARADDPRAPVQPAVVEVEAPAAVVEPDDLHHAEPDVAEPDAVLEEPVEPVPGDCALEARGLVGQRKRAHSRLLGRPGVLLGDHLSVDFMHGGAV